MPSLNNSLTPAERGILLDVARRSIASGLEHGCPLPVEPADYPEMLRPLRATFVTLEKAGRLRGCIGTLEAIKPLVEDVADHAFAAAFEDPRFPPLDKAEWPGMSLHVAVLSPPKALTARTEDELLKQLRPGVDGVILRLGARRATFLPSVWESLSDPYIFLAQLKQKAGLPLDFWSDEMRAERYTTESFADVTAVQPDG
ncbi:MAG: AmmeMemoRadiSam system protein A [Gammaproteobacteria bacterium]|nr:AmmeMemoRadiSam system protein A [Gammaproteobacteria bacterium]MCP5424892.1 AmmeMemoRadiSam system protein A [Gammaproteobacteria bacterium]MCP5458132.1 AmmeMemoRadiSam system protein A [Gammaproteobacteria bacterium]